MLQVSGFLEHSTVNGEGLRSVLFVSGCHHACPGCQNEMMQDKAYGELLSIDAIYQRILKNQPILDGVTFSGGEPFEQSEALSKLAKRLKNTDLTIWCYSGYTYEQLKEIATYRVSTKTLLSLVDVLVDGPFIQSLADPNLKYRGSSNQHIYALEQGVMIRCLDDTFI